MIANAKVIDLRRRRKIVAIGTPVKALPTTKLSDLKQHVLEGRVNSAERMFLLDLIIKFEKNATPIPPIVSRGSEERDGQRGTAPEFMGDGARRPVGEDLIHPRGSDGWTSPAFDTEQQS